MKLPFSQGVTILTPLWVSLPALLLFVLKLALDPGTLLCTLLLAAFLLLLLLLSSSCITQTHYRRLLPRRSIPLAEAELTLCGETRAQLRCGDTAAELTLPCLSRASRAALIHRLRTACASCTEEPAAPRRLLSHTARAALVSLLICLVNLALSSCLPAPAAAEEAARLTGEHSTPYYTRQWHRAGTAKKVGDQLYLIATEKQFHPERSYSEEELAQALGLAAVWYRRAADAGNAHAVVMLAYLEKSGAPLPEVEGAQAQAAEAFAQLATLTSPGAEDLAALLTCYRFGLGTNKDAKKAAEIRQTLLELKK